MFRSASPIGVADVARLLSDRRNQGKHTSLVLGSRSGGLFGNQTFYDCIKGYSLRKFEDLSEIDKYQECYRVLKERFNEEDVRKILTASLRGIADREEDELLAGLVQAGLFDAIISTNIDSLLEDTFVLKGMRRPTDFLILNGLDNNSGRLHLTENCCTMIKVFGDLGSLKYRVPIEDFSLNTKRSLRTFLKSRVSHDTLVLGYDHLWDAPLEHVFVTSKGLCYVDEDLPPENSKIASALEKGNGKYLAGLSYKRFTRELYSIVIGKPPRQRARRTAPLAETASMTIAKPLKRERRKIFVSYSHRDKPYLERFRDHMKPHLRNEQDLLELWDDSKIEGGQRWDEQIKEALATTKVAVLLVSVDFFASDYIQRQELPPLLEAAKTREVTILPVILDHCSFSASSLSAYQAMNSVSLPLAEMKESERDLVWVRTAHRVNNIMRGVDEE